MDLLELSTAKTSDFPVAPDLGQTLWPHQVAAVEYACKTRRMMLADDVGVGKTAAALATIQVLSAYPALIVVPAYLRYKWTREIGNWLPGARIRLVEPGEPLTNGATPDVFVVSYNLLETHAAALKAKSIRAFIADEGHYMKSRKADRTRACIKTAKKVDLRMILGATPVERAPKDLVSQLEVIDQLDQFGGSWHFLQHYCNRWGDNISAPSKWARWDFDGARNLDELNRRLRATCFMRRTREQVHASLPPLTLSRQDLFISNRTEYRTATLDFLGWLHTVEPDRVMAAARAEALTRVAHLRRLAAIGKREATTEWIDGFLEQNTDQKLVVFTYFRSSAEYFGQRFAAPVILGGVSLKKRDELVQRFQVDPQQRLIIVSLEAGGVGIDLPAASNCLLFEFDWVPTTHTQAIGRLHRPGQRNPVTAWYMVGRETIDEDIFQLISARAGMIDAINTGSKPQVEIPQGIAPSQEESLFAELIASLRRK